MKVFLIAFNLTKKFYNKKIIQKMNLEIKKWKILNGIKVQEIYKRKLDKHKINANVCRFKIDPVSL